MCRVVGVVDDVYVLRFCHAKRPTLTEWGTKRVAGRIKSRRYSRVELSPMDLFGF